MISVYLARRRKRRTACAEPEGQPGDDSQQQAADSRRLMSALHLILTAAVGTLQPLDVKALAEWISTSGGYVGPVAAQQRGGYRGLFCTQDGVRAGEPLLAVPRCCTLRGAAGKGKRPIEMLIASLLAERDAGATSEFAQYLESLPASVPLLPPIRA